jgi:hypothetical protein
LWAKISGALEWVCQSQYQLNDGTIFCQGGAPTDTSDSVTIGITGGTGRYSNVGGTAVVYYPDEGNISGMWKHDVVVYFN